MRTTVDLDEDVLLLVREIAGRQGVSIGKVLSDLVREALSKPDATTMRDGVPLFSVQRGAGTATLELVNELRDEVS